MANSSRDLQEIVACAPDDDELLLVVADRFEERGDSARAELLRLQLAIARGDRYDPAIIDLGFRERALLLREGGRWRAESSPWEGASVGGFRRGFPTQIHVHSPAVLAAIASDVPRGVTGVSLASLGEPGSLRGLPELPWLRHLEIASQAAVDRLPELLDSPLVCESLDELSLVDQSLGGADIALLATCAALGRLRALHLRHNHVGLVGIEAITRSPHLNNLRELSLGATTFGNIGAIGPEGILALLAWKVFPDLVRLELLGHGLDGASATTLLEAQGSLRLLDLSDNSLEGLGPLRGPGHPLERLHLRYCELSDRELNDLLSAPSLAHLRALDLSHNRLGRRAARLLVDSPCWAMGSLQECNVTSAALHRAVTPLARAARAPVMLDLTKCGLDEEDLGEIASASWFGSLRSLRIVANPIRFPGAVVSEALASTRVLRHFATGPQDLHRLALFPSCIAELMLTSLSAELARAEMPDLVSLRLIGKLEPDQVGLLAQAPWFSRLARLDLRGAGLGPSAVAMLLAGAPEGLRILELSANRIGGAIAQMLGHSSLRRLEALSVDERDVPPEIAARFLDPSALPSLRRLTWRGLVRAPLRERFEEPDPFASSTQQ